MKWKESGRDLELQNDSPIVVETCLTFKGKSFKGICSLSEMEESDFEAQFHSPLVNETCLTFKGEIFQRYLQLEVEGEWERFRTSKSFPHCCCDMSHFQGGNLSMAFVAYLRGSRAILKLNFIPP